MLKKKVSATIVALAIAALFCASAQAAHHKSSNSVKLTSSGSIAFGPDGILFVADQKAAKIYALHTGDTEVAAHAKTYKIKDIDAKVAGVLGVSADQVLINDLAVNPISHNVWLSVSRGKGEGAQPVILKVNPGAKISALDLNNIKHSQVAIPNAPEDKMSGSGRRAQNKRMSVVTDLGFVNDQVIIAGLSNEEFASNLRSIPFPFKKADEGSSVEIYHGNHGKYETHSPIRTFVPFDFGGDVHIVAAYTCTPLVTFPLSELKPKAHVMGKTIAELGNRNRPLDMVVYSKEGSDYLLMANSARGIMKVETLEFDTLPGIKEKVADKEGTKYTTMEGWQGIEQLDLLDSANALVLQKSESGALILLSLALP